MDLLGDSDSLMWSPLRSSSMESTGSLSLSWQESVSQASSTNGNSATTISPFCRTNPTTTSSTTTATATPAPRQLVAPTENVRGGDDNASFAELQNFDRVAAFVCAATAASGLPRGLSAISTVSSIGEEGRGGGNGGVDLGGLLGEPGLSLDPLALGPVDNTPNSSGGENGLGNGRC